jgi:hypothetical protein
MYYKILVKIIFQIFIMMHETWISIEIRQTKTIFCEHYSMHPPLYYNFLQFLNKLIKKNKSHLQLGLILNPLGENEFGSIHDWGTEKECPSF